MHIGLFRREHLQSGNAQLVGEATADQFARSHGAISAWQEVEHTEDGHHADITCDSITVAGDVVVGGGIDSGDGGFSGEGGHVGVGELPIAGTPGQSGGYGIQIGPWRIISDPQNSPSTPTYPGLIFQMLNEGLGNFLFRFIRLGTYDYAFAPQTGLQLALGWGSNRLSNVITAVLNCVGVANVGSLASAGAITGSSVNVGGGSISCSTLTVVAEQYERNRVTPMAMFTDVPLASCLFYTAAGPFVPGAGSAVRTALVGRMAFIEYELVACSVPAGAGHTLYMKLNNTALGGAGFAMGGYLQPLGRAIDNGFVTPAMMQVADALTLIVNRTDFVAWLPTANGTHLGGMFIGSVI
jgi:hypothetical protein